MKQPVLSKAGKAGGTGLMLLLLAACQTVNEPQHPRLPPPTEQEMQAAAEKQCATPQPGINKPDCLYTAKIAYGIQRNFYNASLYAGRQCTLTIRYNDKGRYEVVSTEGDEVLCKKAWGVVSSADYLPPPPANLPKEMVLDFKPGR